MAKTRDSVKAAKKSPLLTMKEKRAVKKSKKEAKGLSSNVNAIRSPTPVAGIKRP